MTIVGPGGVGKTTLGLACARRLEGAFADGVAFVEVSGGLDPAVGLAAALELRFSDGEISDLVVSHIARLELMVVLDSCEYAIDAVARLAGAIVRRSPKTVVLCTSREPLQAEGEFVWRTEPLATPKPHDHLTATKALEYPSVGLFVDRATAADHRFALTDEAAAPTSRICRRLDGLPLAIELAAGHAAVFGLKSTEAALDNRFGALVQGRRTAVPRHRTLAAAIDWSYESADGKGTAGAPLSQPFPGAIPGRRSLLSRIWRNRGTSRRRRTFSRLSSPRALSVSIPSRSRSSTICSTPCATMRA